MDIPIYTKLNKNSANELYSSSSSSADINLANITNTQGFYISNDYTIYSASGGDVNGDGYDDVIISITVLYEIKGINEELK